MLKLFNKNMIVQVLLILAVLMLLWGRALLSPTPMADGDAVLYHLLYIWLAPLPLLAVVLAMLLVLAGGIGLNLLLSDIGLVPQTTLLPSLLYIVFVSAQAATLTPIIIVNAILIALVHQLMLRTTLLTISTDKICSATAIIGLCSMFYLPALAMMASYLLVVVSYRLYSWRDWVAMLLGLAAPYIVLVTVLFMSDNLSAWWDTTVAALNTIGVHIAKASALVHVATGMLLVVALYAVMYLWIHLGEHTIVWQKNASTVMLICVGAAAMLFYSSLIPADVAVFAIPFALCGCHMLMPEKRQTMGSSRRNKLAWVPDVILILTIAAAMIC